MTSIGVSVHGFTAPNVIESAISTGRSAETGDPVEPSVAVTIPAAVAVVVRRFKELVIILVFERHLRAHATAASRHPPPARTLAS